MATERATRAPRALPAATPALSAPPWASTREPSPGVGSALRNSSYRYAPSDPPSAAAAAVSATSSSRTSGRTSRAEPRLPAARTNAPAERRTVSRPLLPASASAAPSPTSTTSGPDAPPEAAAGERSTSVWATLPLNPWRSHQSASSDSGAATPAIAPGSHASTGPSPVLCTGIPTAARSSGSPVADSAVTSITSELHVGRGGQCRSCRSIRWRSGEPSGRRSRQPGASSSAGAADRRGAPRASKWSCPSAHLAMAHSRSDSRFR